MTATGTPYGPITHGRNWDFFQKITVSNTTFNPYADMLITFTTQGVQMLNLGGGSGNDVVEFSLNGTDVAGELYNDGYQPIVFDNRVMCKIWFRVQSGSGGSIVVSVNAWATH